MDPEFDGLRRKPTAAAAVDKYFNHLSCCSQECM